MIAQPPANIVDRVIETALQEDLGLSGDLTSTAIFDGRHRTAGRIVARRPGVIAGVEIARRVFGRVDASVEFTGHIDDGDPVSAGEAVAEVAGPTRSLLTAERTALNLLGRLSGIATLTRAYVDAVAGTGAAIADTRKTTPGLRALEKFAVRAGGGRNHRMGLHDAVMIKDNHIAAAGGLTSAVDHVRRAVGHTVKIEVEVDTLEQLDELLAMDRLVDIVLLDNMAHDELADAVRRIDGRLIAEASGGISLDTVAATAATGVDVISVGALTHSAPNLDIALDT